MLGLAVFILITATISSILYDFKMFQRFWKWMKL